MNKSGAQEENDDEFIKDFELEADQYSKYSEIAKKAWEFMEKGHQDYDSGEFQKALLNYEKALELYKEASIHNKELGQTDIDLATKWMQNCNDEIEAW